MPLLGTITNVIAVLIGSLIGMAAGNRLPERMKQMLLNALGLGTLFIGMRMALKTQNELLIIGALLAGGIVGELLRIDQRLDGIAERLQKTVRSDSPTFINGFVTATLLFCVGPMTFIGSFQDGMGDGKLLYIKSLLDCFASLALASALGIGVLFSALSVLLIQGSLALLGMFIGEAGDVVMINEITAAGGLMIVGIGITLLGLKKIPVANFLPAFLFVPLLLWIIRCF